MATPRDLDPKFTTEHVTATDIDATPDADDARDQDNGVETVERDADESQIVYRQNYINEQGQPATREHGPMPVSDWPAYEKENGL